MLGTIKRDPPSHCRRRFDHAQSSQHVAEIYAAGSRDKRHVIYQTTALPVYLRRRQRSETNGNDRYCWCPTRDNRGFSSSFSQAIQAERRTGVAGTLRRYSPGKERVNRAALRGARLPAPKSERKPSRESTPGNVIGDAGRPGDDAPAARRRLSAKCWQRRGLGEQLSPACGTNFVRQLIIPAAFASGTLRSKLLRIVRAIELLVGDQPPASRMLVLAGCRTRTMSMPASPCGARAAC